MRLKRSEYGSEYEVSRRLGRTHDQPLMCKGNMSVSMGMTQITNVFEVLYNGKSQEFIFDNFEWPVSERKVTGK